ncbi:MAG: hypothetical protein RIR53_582 [Bacteroidota bacterium]
MMFRSYHTITLYTLAAALGITFAACNLNAQIILKGVIDQCHAVQILDKVLPVDSLRINPPLRESTSSAVLLGMVGAFAVPKNTDAVSVTGDVGLSIPITCLSVSDTLTIIEPITLDAAFRRNIYQMVVPIEADSIVIGSELTATAWDGTRGGVIMLHARDVIDMRASINVSGLGFAGGRRSADGGACGMIVQCDPIISDRTAQKGFSPLLPDPLCASGHIPWASGGGGGDAHNAGGGGGGNGGSGGRGGDQYPCSNPSGMWGMGGMRLDDDDANRLFLGGGAGGGHQNNGLSTDGERGGGIVVLQAPLLRGDSIIIRSRGNSVRQVAGNDGAGGGGAGGSVALHVCTLKSPLTVDVSGGRGGNANASHGPGGGGAGGRVLLQPALVNRHRREINVIATGGQSGSVNGQPQNSNGAERGEDGRNIALCNSVTPHDVYVPPYASIGDTLSVVFIPRGQTPVCECTITHEVNLEGFALAAITEGTTRIDGALLTTKRSSTGISFRVEIPSRQSVSIPMLAVLTSDSIVTATNGALIEGFGVDTGCVWDGQETLINIDACARSQRRVTLRSPFGITARSDASRNVTITLESTSDVPTFVRIYTSLGTLMSEHDVTWMQTSEGNASVMHLDTSTWPQGIYFVLAQTSQGIRTVMIRL